MQVSIWRNNFAAVHKLSFISFFQQTHVMLHLEWKQEKLFWGTHTSHPEQKNNLCPVSLILW